MCQPFNNRRMLFPPQELWSQTTSQHPPVWEKAFEQNTHPVLFTELNIYNPFTKKINSKDLSSESLCHVTYWRTYITQHCFQHSIKHLFLFIFFSCVRLFLGRMPVHIPCTKPHVFVEKAPGDSSLLHQGWGLLKSTSTHCCRFESVRLFQISNDLSHHQNFAVTMKVEFIW